MRQAIGALREDITRDLAADLTLMPKLQHLDPEGLHVMADLIVKSVFATLPDIIDPPAQALPAHLTPQAKITQQLRFIFIGLKHWQGPGQHRVSQSPSRMETLGGGVVFVPVAVAQRIDTHASCRCAANG